jgi:hypothetical protein
MATKPRRLATLELPPLARRFPHVGLTAPPAGVWLRQH